MSYKENIDNKWLQVKFEINSAVDYHENSRYEKAKETINLKIEESKKNLEFYNSLVEGFLKAQKDTVMIVWSRILIKKLISKIV